MAETPHKSDLPEVPEATSAPKSGRTIQLVWLIPLVAALVGGWLAVKAILDKGPVITITFETAEGLEAGKTKLKYKDVEVGLVSSVTLANNGKNVIATAELVKEAAPRLVEDTRFWVVRPRISGGTVSGLSTLLGGPYIGVDIGKSDKPRRDFVGLEVPPVILSNNPGREFILHSDNLGSMDVGSPIYFRRLQSGQVSGYELDKNGKGVTIRVFINTPYDQFVTPNTRFWQASGIDITLDATGVKVQTQSLVSILVGGLAFETPLESTQLPPAEPNTSFTLFGTRAVALKNPETVAVKFVMVFNESLRGLTLGAPVDFRGIELGNVSAIKADIDDKNRRINMVVEADIYPARLRERAVEKQKALSEEERRAFMKKMIENGLRAQLRTGNLLTGQLFVALDFHRDAPRARFRVDADRVEVPTIASSMRELQQTIADVASKIQALPLNEISGDLRETLQTATKTMQRLDAELTAEAKETLLAARGAMAEAKNALNSADRVLKSDSPLQSDARDMMHEISRAAEAFRVLADYLERHPEALIGGKKPDGGSKDSGKDSADKQEVKK